MKNLQNLIQKISEMSESSERITSDSGETELYKVFRRENLNMLKKLAPQYYSVLAEAFNATEDHQRRTLLCECLQHAKARELEPLFEKLLNQDDPELRCCAMVALGRLGNVNALTNIYPRVLQTGDRSTRFFLGCAFIHAHNKEGVDLLVSILREEQLFVTFEDGYVTTSIETIIFSPTIDGILSGLIHGDSNQISENPFGWIVWWDSHGDEFGAVDPTIVTPHLIEYTHNMIVDIDKQRSH